MGLTELIFGAPVKVRVGVGASDEFLPAGAIEFDASVTETHDAENEITQFPVESGADITDHIRPQPERITINGVVTNTPIVFLGGIASDPARAEDAYAKVKSMRDNGDLVSVVTSLRQYDNMAIESFSVLRDAQNGNVMNATLTLREIFIAETATVAAPEPEAGQAGGAGASNLGEQSTPPAPEAQNTSALSAITGFGG